LKRRCIVKVGFILAVGLLASCGETGSDATAGTSRSAANDVEAEVVRLRIYVTVLIPEGESDLDLEINGEGQRLVDVVAPADLRRDDQEEPDDEEPIVVRRATGEYERMTHWGENGASREVLRAVDRSTGTILIETEVSTTPLCSSVSEPLPTEIYYKWSIAKRSPNPDQEPVWRLYREGRGCLYADPRYDMHADS
jgi:hypothetical protein